MRPHGLLARLCRRRAKPFQFPHRLLYAASGLGGRAMTFEEILDQAVAMLQRRGRLTYGALKRQFQLDDTYLEDLKAELIEGQRVAVDEDGRVLVWTGSTDPAASSWPFSARPQPVTLAGAPGEVSPVVLP